MAAVVAAIASHRDAANVTNLVPAPNNTGYRALKIPAIAFKLNLVEGHAISARANLFGIATALKINISEAEIMRFIADRPAAGSDGPALGLAIAIIIIAMTIMPVSVAGRIADRCVPLRTNTELKRAISRFERHTACDVFSRLSMVCERGRCEEQRRRKGERGCSGFHDTFHHGCRNTHMIST